MNNFEEKRQARIERLNARAELAISNSEKAYQNSHKLSEHIPMGQPILVGHHSEKRHRRDLDKIANEMRKSIDENRKAEYYQSRAEAAAKNKAIFSDDPKAEEKLNEKIERLEQQQDLMRKANSAVRKNDKDKLLDLGFTDEQSELLLTGDRYGRRGFPTYVLTNNNANIRRLKERLKGIEKKSEMETTEKIICGIRIVNDVEDNRTRIFFNSKPGEDVRKKLKSWGFRWSPDNNAWQRHLSTAAEYYAEKIIIEFYS